MSATGSALPSVTCKVAAPGDVWTIIDAELFVVAPAEWFDAEGDLARARM